MIYRLQKKFILISALSVFLVIFLMFILISALSIRFITSSIDMLADEISRGEGRFPDSFGENIPKPDKPGGKKEFDFINPETRFATRHFTVWFDGSGEALRINTEFIYSVSDSEAVEYASEALNENEERGWIDGYRYKAFQTKDGTAIALVDARSQAASLLRTITISGVVLFSSGLIVILLIIVFSKRAMKPVNEGYEKQKRFITDANHELKTPLTLILANLDIAESELGKNEWLDDMRSEGERMRALVEELVVLSRLDEESRRINSRSEVNLSDAVADTVSEFVSLANQKGKQIKSEVEDNLYVLADEALIRRLISILLDNAVKYCDADGEIFVSLKKRRTPILTVENTYAQVDSIEINRIFDRFYRADKARSFEGGFGIGLSMAKSICENHKLQISAYKKNANTIGFKVIF